MHFPCAEQLRSILVADEKPAEAWHYKESIMAGMSDEFLDTPGGDGVDPLHIGYTLGVHDSEE